MAELEGLLALILAGEGGSQQHSGPATFYCVSLQSLSFLICKMGTTLIPLIGGVMRSWCYPQFEMEGSHWEDRLFPA